jgi:hypothetical protein
MGRFPVHGVAAWCHPSFFAKMRHEMPLTRRFILTERGHSFFDGRNLLLEGFSQSISPYIDYEMHQEGSLVVNNQTAHLYRNRANPPLSYTSRACEFWIHASNAVSSLFRHEARSKPLR